MTTHYYQLATAELQQMRIDWSFGWHNFIVSIAERAPQHYNFDELRKGVSIPLTDTDTITIQVRRPYRPQDLHVKLNGERLYGFDPSLPAAITYTYYAVLAIGTLMIGLGIVEQFTHSYFLRTAGIGQHSLVIGIGVMLLSLLVKRISQVALIMVLLLLGMHWFYGSSFNAHFERFTPKGGTVIHLILAIVLFRGMRIFEAWWRQFPPQQHRWRSFWRNSAIMFAIVMMPLVFLVILLYTN